MSSSSSYEIYLCQSDCDLQHQTVPTNAYLVWGNAWYFLIGEKAFFRYHHQSEDPATSFTGLAKPQQGCGPGCGTCCLTFLPVGPECRCCGAWCISFELTIHIRRVANRSSQAAAFVHACQRAVRDRQDINHELFFCCVPVYQEDDNSWVDSLTSTDKMQIHLARAFISNPHVLVGDPCGCWIQWREMCAIWRGKRYHQYPPPCESDDTKT